MVGLKMVGAVNIIKPAAPDINQQAMAEIQAMWKMPTTQIASIKKMASIVSSKHGMLSGVPIICRGDDCAYQETCMIEYADRVVGSRCPQEIGALLSRFSNLCNELGVTVDDYVDLGQVKEVVDIEIMIMRCDNKMAIDANFIERSVKDIARNGKVLYENKISQAVELKLSLLERHSKLLKDLNASRNSKNVPVVVLDPSQTASMLIQKAKEIDARMRAMPINVVDEDYIDVEESSEIIETEVYEEVDS